MLDERREPCEKCGSDRWKTVQKKRAYKCRKCGKLRTLWDNDGERYAEAVRRTI